MTAMTVERHLVVFLRTPRLGTVKRRLARDVGPVAAWRFYRTTSAALLRRLAHPGRWRCWVAVTPDRAAIAGRALWPRPWRPIPQGGGDLGARMGRVLACLPPGPVVIVGSDVPDIGPGHVAAAFRDLGGHDWVIGPATDGGYWLIGARRRPSLRLPFAGVRWGGPHARADTLAGLGGLQVAELAELSDIDSAADLARRRARKNRGPRRI